MIVSVTVPSCRVFVSCVTNSLFAEEMCCPRGAGTGRPLFYEMTADREDAALKWAILRPRRVKILAPLKILRGGLSRGLFLAF